jgi:hypothetical protein
MQIGQTVKFANENATILKLSKDGKRAYVAVESWAMRVREPKVIKMWVYTKGLTA